MCKLGGHVHPCAMCSMCLHVLLFCISFGLHLLIIQVIISGPPQPIKGGANVMYFKIEQSIVMLPNLCHTLLFVQHLGFNLHFITFKGVGQTSPIPHSHAPSRYPYFLGMPCFISSTSFRKFITKTQRRAQRNKSLKVTHSGPQHFSMVLFFVFKSNLVLFLRFLFVCHLLFECLFICLSNFI